MKYISPYELHFVLNIVLLLFPLLISVHIFRRRTNPVHPIKILCIGILSPTDSCAKSQHQRPKVHYDFHINIHTAML